MYIKQFIILILESNELHETDLFKNHENKYVTEFAGHTGVIHDTSLKNSSSSAETTTGR